MFVSYSPRHEVVKVMVARRCGQSFVARRRCAERSEFFSFFFCNMAAVGVGRGWFFYMKEAQVLREHGDGLQFLWRELAFGGVELQIVVSSL